MCELEWNRALLKIALTNGAVVSMSAFETQYILDIHCDTN